MVEILSDMHVIAEQNLAFHLKRSLIVHSYYIRSMPGISLVFKMHSSGAA